MADQQAELYAKLWPSFASETTDIFDSLVALLAINDHKSINIDGIFRHFHTLKANCSAFGFEHMAEIAHLSEDILSACRQEKAGLNPDIKKILLAAIAVLKKQFVDASVNNKDSEAPADIIDRLNAMKVHTPPVSTETPSLQTFTTLVQKTLPSLILALNPKAKTNQVIPALHALSDEALACHFPVLSKVCYTSINVLGTRDFISKLSSIIQQIERIRIEHNLTLALDSAISLARYQLHHFYHDSLDALSALLLQIKPEQDNCIHALNHCLLPLNTLHSFSVIQHYPQHQLFWQYCKQFFSERIKAKELFSIALMDKLVQIIHLLKESTEEAQQDRVCENEIDAFKAEASQINQPIADIFALSKAILSQSSIHPDGLKSIPLNALKQLLAGINKGQHVLEIDVDFSHEKEAENVLSALQRLTTIVHSRTIFHKIAHETAEKTSLCFLLLSEKNSEELQVEIGPLAKESRCFRWVQRNTLSAQQKSVPVKADTSATQLAKETSLSLASVKISSQAIDHLIHLVTETINTHNSTRYLLEKEDNTSNSIKNDDHLIKQLSQLQALALSFRVVPVSILFERLTLLAESTSKHLHLPVRLDITGGDLSVDKTLIDALAEPMAHLIRNSLDHGIEDVVTRRDLGKPEKGQLILNAQENEGDIIISLSDDGKGLDTQRIKEKAISFGLISTNEEDLSRIHACIFEPAFSTADTLSSVSGRGVGMDVVNTKVHALGGHIQLSSKPNQGTKVSIHVPISTILQPVVLIKNQTQILAISERTVQEIVTLDAFDIAYEGEQQVMNLHDDTLPVFYLNQLFNTRKLQSLDVDFFDVVVVSNGESRIGIVVDQVVGRAEVLVREQHPLIKQMPSISNATVLGDGQVVFILDTSQLFDASMNKNKEERAL